MCRWMAWLGQPVPIAELVFKTQHGIVDQSLHARMGAEPTNGDGFGVGWYGGAGELPGVYRNISPAWSDVNLRELAEQVVSPLFLVHVRAAIGSPGLRPQLISPQRSISIMRVRATVWIKRGCSRTAA